MAVSGSNISAAPAEESESPLSRLVFGAWYELVQLTPFHILLDTQKKGPMLQHWIVLWQDQWRRQQYFFRCFSGGW